MEPSTNGTNGRTGNGRFANGNGGGPGNPHGKRVAALRAVMLEAVTDDDLREVVAKLVAMAKGGDLAAVRELFDRTLGKPPAGVSVDVMTTTTPPPFPSLEERHERIRLLKERLGIPVSGEPATNMEGASGNLPAPRTCNGDLFTDGECVSGSK